MDISRAEQEPFTAEQEQGITDDLLTPSQYSLSNNHEVIQLGTIATDTTSVGNSTQHFRETAEVDYHGDDSVNDDYIELLGRHRTSPIFI